MHIRTTRSRQHRPALGFVLLACAAFVAYLPSFGLLGRGLHRLLLAGIGRNGLDLLACTLCLCGTVCVLPPGTLVKIIVKAGELVAWLFTGLALGVAKLVDLASRAAPETKAVVRAPAKVIAFRGSMNCRHCGQMRGPQCPHAARHDIIATAPPAMVMHRRKLDDVRGALKQLGFKPGEFEHIVAPMDGSRPIEMLVREALVQLRKAVVS